MRRSILGLTVLTCCAIPLALFAASRPDNRTDLIQTYIQQIWNDGNVAAMDELFTPDFVRYGPTMKETVIGRRAWSDHVAETFSLYSDIKTTVDDLTTEGDRAILSWTWQGTTNGAGELPAGKPVKIHGTAVYTFDGNQIASERLSWDYVGVAHQLGVTSQFNTREQAVHLTKRLLHEVYGKGDLAVTYDIIAADHVFHVPASDQTLRGPEALQKRVTMFRKALPDLTFEIHDTMVDGDLVTTRWTFTGTHEGEFLGVAPTNKRVVASGLSMARVADGKLVETWGVWDTGAVLEQLGAR